MDTLFIMRGTPAVLFVFAFFAASILGPNAALSSQVPATRGADTIAAFFGRLNALLAAGKYDEAEALLKKSPPPAADPKFLAMQLHFRLGEVYIAQSLTPGRNRYAEAVVELNAARKLILERVSKKNPWMAPIYKSLVLAHDRSGDAANTTRYLELLVLSGKTAFQFNPQMHPSKIAGLYRSHGADELARRFLEKSGSPKA